MSAPRTPQEKKALSYAKDRRNTFGENDKASRKAIPARKAGENRKVRRKANQALDAVDQVDEVASDLIESSLRHDVNRVGGWRKGRDEPLGVVVERALGAREQRVGRKMRSRFDYSNGS